MDVSVFVGEHFECYNGGDCHNPRSVRICSWVFFGLLTLGRFEPIPSEISLAFAAFVAADCLNSLALVTT